MEIILPSGLGDTALLALIVGFIAPVVYNLLIQSGWSARTQSIVAFLFSAVLGGVTALVAGAFNGVGIVTSILIVFVVAISTYQSFWKKVTPNLKEATSINGVYQITDIDGNVVDVKPEHDE